MEESIFHTVEDVVYFHYGPSSEKISCFVSPSVKKFCLFLVSGELPDSHNF